MECKLYVLGKKSCEKQRSSGTKWNVNVSNGNQIEIGLSVLQELSGM